MSEMKRLTDGPLSPDIAALLQSADTDVPPAARQKEDRVLAALTTTAAATAAPATQSFVWSALTRNVGWVGLGILVVTASAVGFAARGSGTASSPVSSGATTVVTNEAAAAEPANIEPSGVTTTAAPVAQAPQPTTAPSLRVDELPSVTPDARQPAKARPLASAARETGTSVENELAIIDAARAALTSGRPTATLEQVKTYRTTFRSPHFADEADVLEVQALAALGRTVEAHAKADRFVASHPNSPYAQRVRSAVGARE